MSKNQSKRKGVATLVSTVPHEDGGHAYRTYRWHGISVTVGRADDPAHAQVMGTYAVVHVEEEVKGVLTTIWVRNAKGKSIPYLCDVGNEPAIVYLSDGQVMWAKSLADISAGTKLKPVESVVFKTAVAKAISLPPRYSTIELAAMSERGKTDTSPPRVVPKVVPEVAAAAATEEPASAAIALEADATRDGSASAASAAVITAGGVHPVSGDEHRAILAARPPCTVYSVIGKLSGTKVYKRECHGLTVGASYVLFSNKEQVLGYFVAEREGDGNELPYDKLTPVTGEPSSAHGCDDNEQGEHLGVDTAQFAGSHARPELIQ